MNRHFIFPLILLMSVLASPPRLTAQDQGFRNPLDIPLTLSGSFAELRGGHFHAGIDIRTNGVEGLPVYAIADGYVSRVRVSAWGYGKAIYITHPNGYTSVYGHLSAIKGPLAGYIVQQQYARESFEVDLYLEKGQFVVRQGDVIALSGNTGGSGGPHLHFEIRRTASQHPVNPLGLGFTISDHKAPVIQSVRVYPVPGKGSVAGGSQPVTLDLKFSGGRLVPVGTDTLNVLGECYLGIRTYDQQDATSNKNGIYELELKADSDTYWLFRSDEFSYDETRYINSLIDFATYTGNGSRYVLSRIQPGNRLAMYEKSVNRGLLAYPDTGLHTLTWIVRDIAGNESEAVIPLMFMGPMPPALPIMPAVMPRTRFRYDEAGRYETDGFRISLPAGALYDSIDFFLGEEDGGSGTLSPVWTVHDRLVPLQASVNLSIRADTIPPGMEDRILVTAIGNGTRKMISTTRNGSWYTARVREFGTYVLMADSVAPVISGLNIREGSAMTNASSIRVKISDAGSGISSYRATVDGKWILMEYEPKQALLFHSFDGHVTPGKHILRLSVTDVAGNTTEYSCHFTR